LAADFKRGLATPDELFEGFLAAWLYSPAPPEPGVFVLDVRGKRVVPVFTSETELERFMGQTAWFSTTGLDLLTLLPEGVTMGLDMASSHRLQLDPTAVGLDREVHLGVSRSDGPRGASGPDREDR
jgi:hypothetical protein